jgi:hypothetical protein
MGGVYNGDPSIRTNDTHGVDFSMDGPVFAIGEIAYQPNSIPGDRGLIGNYKAGFWYDNSRFSDFSTGEFERGNWGFYTLFDQVLVRFGEQGSHRGFGIAVTFLPLLSAVGLAGAYALYAVAAAISLPFVWAAVRETKGKTLEQMKDTTNLSQVKYRLSKA